MPPKHDEMCIRDSYWYEGGKRQGYDTNNAAYRGKEIYDPVSNGWSWLDNVQQGAKAVSKDVYQAVSYTHLQQVFMHAISQLIRTVHRVIPGAVHLVPVIFAVYALPCAV